MAEKQGHVLPAAKAPKTMHHFRLAADVLAMIDEMRKVHGHSRTAIIEHAVKWMHAEWDKERRRR